MTKQNKNDGVDHYCTVVDTLLQPLLYGLTFFFLLLIIDYFNRLWNLVLVCYFKNLKEVNDNVICFYKIVSQ